MRLSRQAKTGETTSETRTAKRNRRLWIAADVAAVTVVGGGLWSYWLNAVPNVRIPAPPPQPSPNAFDTFSRATTLIAQKEVIDGASSKPDQLPKERNGIPYSEAEKAAAVAANAEVLATVRAGFSQTYQHPARRGFDALFPELAKFRETARLFNLEGQFREANGDFGGAAQSRLDAIQFGVEIPRGGNLISALVGFACEAIGRQSLWNLADKLTASEARDAAKRLEAINARRVSLADAFQEEKWSAETSLLKAFQTGSTFAFVQGLYSSTSDDSTSNTRKLAPMILPLLTTSKSQIIANHTAYMDVITARTRLPFTVASRLPRVPEPTDPVNALICPVFDGARIKEADMRMQSSLLTAVFALRAYQADHSAYPEDLNALIGGGYLARVPSDPFSSTGDAPVQYRRLENGTYRLYSIGPDGKDDAGTPIEAKFANGRSKNWVEADMKGDFVIGVNTVRTDKETATKIQ